MEPNVNFSPTLFPLAGNAPGRSAQQLGSIPPHHFIWAALGAWKLQAMRDDRIACWISPVCDAVSARYIAKPATARKAVDETARLLKYLSRTAERWPDITPQMIADWCCAARPNPQNAYPRVAANTAANRGWAARAALEAAQALGADVDASSLAADTPRREASDLAMRPLTEAEARQVCAHARGGIITTDLPLIVALSLAGASAAEIATVTAGGIDAARGFVRLPGTDSLAARINPLCDWGQRTVAFQMRNRTGIDPGAPLCVTPGLALEQATHSVTVRLRRVLEAARISHLPGVVPRSIRYTAAHRIAHAHGIIAATRFLGAHSVDAAIAVFERSLREGSDGG